MEPTTPSNHVQGRPPSPPISADLWQRLRRFDPHCEIALVRTSPMYESPWAAYKRIWVASIRPFSPERINFEMVRHIHPTLAEALRLAVKEA
jgi:hypothetical protein